MGRAKSAAGLSGEAAQTLAGRELVPRDILDGRDANESVSVFEACRFLGISRRTLYRLDSLPRVRLSAGRVGYRVGDLREHARRGLDNRSPYADTANVWIVDKGGELLPDFFLGLPGHINTILRRRPASMATSLAFSAELPPARAWTQRGHRELVIIDFDGLNEIEPMALVAQEDEELFGRGPEGRARILITEPRAIVRLVPLFGWPEQMSSGWWVA